MSKRDGSGKVGRRKQMSQIGRLAKMRRKLAGKPNIPALRVCDDCASHKAQQLFQNVRDVLMTFSVWFWLGVLLVGGGIILQSIRADSERSSDTSPSHRENPEEATGDLVPHNDEWRSLSENNEKLKSDTIRYGALEAKMICPHCQVKGTVHKRSVLKKTGISGAKAAGGFLTGGVSLLLTGLSRSEHYTQAHCTNCSSTWYF